MTQKVRPKVFGKVVLAYDLGGTKVQAGVVTEKGKILAEVRTPVLFEKGKAAVLRQLSDIGEDFLRRYPKIKVVGMASAGPLDPGRGILLDPTNFTSSEGSWGRVPIAAILSKSLKRKVCLENDAAAAVLAEAWIGAGKGYDNVMILTLGTGLGTGIIANGQLVRSGRGMHPEAGHLMLNGRDTTAPCGCGNLGCAEAYLSGRNFTRRTRTRFGNPQLTGEEIANLARKQDPRALAAFEEYAEYMAVAIHNYVVLYAPEIVVFTGSFANTSDLFIDSTRSHLERLLVRRRVGVDFMPKLAVSKLENSAGLIGAAHVAFNR